MSSQKNEHCFLQKKKCVWLTATMNCNLIIITMFSIFWSITSLLAFDIPTYCLRKNSKYFFTFFTVTEFLKTLKLTIHIYNDFILYYAINNYLDKGRL
jgi:hypothetical protein